MPTDNTEFVGRFIASLVLLFTAIFFALITINGHGLEVYTSETQLITQGFPPWNVTGASFNGTTNSSGTLEITAASEGTYTYTSPVVAEDNLVQLSDFTYRASIPKSDGQSITVKVYTSDDGFATIENSQSFDLDDGVGSRVIDLPREKHYRIQVLMSYSGTGNEPTIDELNFNGITVEKEEDFTPLFFTIAFWLLMIMAIFVLVPR